MRASVLLLVAVCLVGCGGEEGGSGLVEPDESAWQAKCGKPNRKEDYLQYYRSDGSPFCPGEAEWWEPHCIRIFGGEGKKDIDLNCPSDETQPIYCTHWDEADPESLVGRWECVQPEEAKRRSL